MNKTFILPKSVNGTYDKPGLYVNYLNIEHQNFEMTSFDIRLPKDGKPISGMWHEELYQAFKDELHKKGYSENDVFILNIFRFGLIINITKCLSKEESLELICDICNEILKYPENTFEYEEHIKDKLNLFLDILKKQNNYNYSNINFEYKGKEYFNDLQQQRFYYPKGS